MTPIPIERLEEVAAWADDVPTKQTAQPGAVFVPFDVVGFIARHDLKIRRSGQWQDGEKWELENCPFDPEHTGGSAVVTRGGNGALGFRCLHNSCTGFGWSELREKLEPGHRKKSFPSNPNSAFQPRTVSASDLYKGQIVKLRPLFDNLMWDGLTMLVARPKAGKSWLTLQLAIDVAGGPAVSGICANEHGPVLYGAFEEPAARTMARLRKLAPDGPWASNCISYTNCCRSWAADQNNLRSSTRP